jgi:hypothetical protein
LNYQWNEEKLRKSSELAGARNFEVFTGIDIFGRNTFGGGGYDTNKVQKSPSRNFPFFFWLNLPRAQALDAICHPDSEKKMSSVGLFAPGWTFEVNAKHDRLLFDRHEERYWEGADFIGIYFKARSFGVYRLLSLWGRSFNRKF